jgi:hypothetical protein
MPIHRSRNAHSVGAASLESSLLPRVSPLNWFDLGGVYALTTARFV